MKPRVTLSLTTSGSLNIFLNEAGRDQLIEELQSLDFTHEHFHLSALDGAEVELQAKTYEPNDTVIRYAKVLYRPDEWDRIYYPHLFHEE